MTAAVPRHPDAPPPTLLQMAGVEPVPARLGEAAVLFIDCQLEYVAGAIPLAGVDAALAEAGQILDRARAAGAPVLHIIHRGRAGGAFDLAGPFGGIAPEVLPAPGEQTVVKTLPNGFAGTDLERLLRETGRDQIVVAGFMTHMCVSSTVRAALDRGFRTTIVGAATATRALPDGTGGVVDATTVQRTALAELADRFATIVPTASALEA